MSRLKKVIYTFLDEYVGDGDKVKSSVVPIYDPFRFLTKNRGQELYSIYSNKGILILSFKVCKNGSIVIFRGLQLCNTICRFFSLGDDEAMEYVKNWFADKHNMKKVSDLLKFIPEPLSCA